MISEGTTGDLHIYLILGLVVLATYFAIPELQEAQQAKEQAIDECVEINKRCLEEVNYNLSVPRCACYS